MPSRVWGRDPQEAFEEPYEYDIQAQFEREARELFTRLYDLLNANHRRYRVDDRSREKAVWLLSMDALDSLRDCLEALTRKEQRIAGKLFRDVMESMDLAAYFNSGSAESDVSLEKWYADEIIPHRKYRDYVKKTISSDAAHQLATHYSSLSRFTHRSYRAILAGYLRGQEDRLFHDETGALLPQPIASYCAVLANLALEYASELAKLGLVAPDEIRDAFAASLESETVPRRFLPRRWLAQRLDELTSERSTEEE